MVCSHLYEHEFYLSPHAATGQKETEANYNKYEYVLPSARTISDYKQMQASQAERDAAVALYQKGEDVKATLHYDTTSRSCIDGEWPAIILYFSDGTEHVLRPIYFAYEDREQISELLVETYHRLAEAAKFTLKTGITANSKLFKVTPLIICT